MRESGGSKSGTARTPSSDNVGREQLNAASAVEESFFVKDYKVLEGRDGWLFLANDSNDVVGQHTGRVRFSDEDLEHWRKLLEARIAFLEERGIRYLFGVAPDAHAIHREQLPGDVVPVAERPIHQLMGHLAECGSPARIVYPLEEMRAARGRHAVSCLVDAHWSEFGAFVAFQRYLDEIEGDVDLRRLDERDLEFVETEIQGDLGFKLGRRGTTVITRMKPSARMLSDNCVHNIGGHLVTECDEAPPTRCLLFGDSFSNALLRFVSESFGRMTFAHLPNMDRELVEQERPDLVMTVMAERFMIRVPKDEGAPSLETQVRYKFNRDELRPAMRLWDWRTPKPGRPLTPLEVERIRAIVLESGGLQDAAMVSALAYGGLRPREAMWLTWPAVTRSRLEVAAIPGGIAAMPPGSSHPAAGPRTLRLLKPLAEDLRRWRKACGSPQDGAVFRNDDGGRWDTDQWRTWVDEVYRPASEAAGLTYERANPHLLRDTFAALLLGEKVSWLEAAEELGQSPAAGPRGVNLIDDKRTDPLPTVKDVEKARKKAAKQARKDSGQTAGSPGALRT
jgi:alginate O-acetyltransferase complex protein AlgJ